jgi:hypothetical protein
MGDEDQRMVCSGKRGDSIDAGSRRHCCVEELLPRRCPKLFNPFGHAVNLDGQRQRRELERAEMMDVPEENRRSDLAEAGSDERPLGRLGVGNQKIEVAERAQERIGVPRGYFRPLEQNDRTVADCSNALKDERGGQGVDCRPPLLGKQHLRYWASERAPAACGEQLKLVLAQVREPRCTVHKAIDARPQVRHG